MRLTEPGKAQNIQQRVEPAAGEKSKAQVLVERRRRYACSTFRSFFQTVKLLLREARQERLLEILLAAPKIVNTAHKRARAS